MNRNTHFKLRILKLQYIKEPIIPHNKSKLPGKILFVVDTHNLNIREKRIVIHKDGTAHEVTYNTFNNKTYFNNIEKKNTFKTLQEARLYLNSIVEEKMNDKVEELKTLIELQNKILTDYEVNKKQQKINDEIKEFINVNNIR